MRSVASIVGEEVPGTVGAGRAVGSIEQRSRGGTQLIGKDHGVDLGLKDGQVERVYLYDSASGVESCDVADVGGVDALQSFKVVVGVQGTVDALSAVEERSGGGAGLNGVDGMADVVGDAGESVVVDVDVTVGGVESSDVGDVLRSVAGQIAQYEDSANRTGYASPGHVDGSSRRTRHSRVRICCQGCLKSCYGVVTHIGVLSRSHQSRNVGTIEGSVARTVLQVVVLADRALDADSVAEQRSRRRTGVGREGLSCYLGSNVG